MVRITLAVAAFGKSYWYRIVEGKAASESDSLLSRDGGRFHGDAASEPTSYAADSVRTAWLEHTQDDENPDLGTFRAVALECPGTFCDLRKAVELRRHGIDSEDLRSDPPSERCRNVARSIRESGAHGIIYPSNRDPQGTCVAIFLENTKGILRWHEAMEEWEEFVTSKSQMLSEP